MIMYYHASQTPDIKVLEPRISNHGIPLVYLSRKRENVLVYLSNAIEKYCRETGFRHEGIYHKWGPYGFEKDGRMRMEEYYPDALKKTYEGVSGYIYACEDVDDSGYETDIPDAITSTVPVPVTGTEYIADAYEEILKAEKEGLITIQHYEEMPSRKRDWLERTTREEYLNADDHPDYQHFLKAHFPIFCRGR